MSAGWYQCLVGYQIGTSIPSSWLFCCFLVPRPGPYIWHGLLLPPLLHAIAKYRHGLSSPRGRYSHRVLVTNTGCPIRISLAPFPEKKREKKKQPHRTDEMDSGIWSWLLYVCMYSEQAACRMLELFLASTHPHAVSGAPPTAITRAAIIIISSVRRESACNPKPLKM